DSDDGSGDDVWMRLKRLLDFGGRYVETAGDDELLEPIDDRHEAIGRNLSDIARSQPSVSEQHRCRVARAPPIAGEDLRPANEEFASLAERQINSRIARIDDTDLRAREGHTHGAGPSGRAHGVAKRYR